MSWLEVESRSVVVDGARIHYRQLGRSDIPPIVLIHGGAAHAGWWIDVVPMLAPKHHVVVAELSGHGESAHRNSYSPALWATEIAAVIDDVGAGPAYVVGHSMGGLIGTLTAGQYPQAVRSLLLIDSVVVRKSDASRSKGARQVRYYDSEAEGMSNFRLRPRNTTASSETLNAVARVGLRRDAQGWRWRFDPSARHRVPEDELAAAVQRITCPVQFALGQFSELVDIRSVSLLESMLDREIPFATVPHAYHHVPLDNPTATVEAIKRSVAAQP